MSSTSRCYDDSNNEFKPQVAAFLDILHDPRIMSCLGSLQLQCLWEHRLYDARIFRLVNLSHKIDLSPIIDAFFPLAMSSQDSSFSQEKSAEEGEVAALRLTARSQVSVSLY